MFREIRPQNILSDSDNCMWAFTGKAMKLESIHGDTFACTSCNATKCPEGCAHTRTERAPVRSFLVALTGHSLGTHWTLTGHSLDTPARPLLLNRTPIIQLSDIVRGCFPLELDAREWRLSLET